MLTENRRKDPSGTDVEDGPDTLASRSQRIIAVSFVTAKLRRGWIVPAIAWILLIAGPIVLALSLQP